MAEEKTLRLQIKRAHLDKILSGEKTVEYRDETDFYIDRLCICDDEGRFIDWKPIETITFVSGYRKGATENVFKLEKIEYEEWLDDNDNPDGVFTFALYLGERIS